MGAPIIGRTECPECGFAGAHVKKSEKCVFRYCPECGSTYHARGGRQADLLMAKTRPADGAPTPTATPAPAPAAGAPTAAPPTPSEPTATEPKAEATPTPPRKRIGLF